MKKLLGILFSAMLLLSIVACAAATPTPTAAPTPTTEPTQATQATSVPGAIPANLPKFKIGVVYWSFADPTGAGFKKSLDYLAKAFNVEFVYIETGMSVEAGQAAFENALQTGLDGVLMVNTGVWPLEASKKAGNIPLVSFSIEPINGLVAKQMSAYDFFLGTVCEDNYQVGVDAINALYDNGARNVVVAGVPTGFVKSHDDRMRGAKDALAAHPDMKLITEDYSFMDLPKAIASFAVSYPDMDGLFTTFGAESINQAIITSNLSGKIKYTTTDIAESSKELFDNGTLVSVATGPFGTTEIAFAVLYNYLYDGTRIIPDTSVTLRTKFMQIATKEDFDLYQKYVVGDVPVYSTDEIAMLIKGFNTAASFESFVHLANSYSLQDVVSRHKNLVP